MESRRRKWRRPNLYRPGAVWTNAAPAGLLCFFLKSESMVLYASLSAPPGTRCGTCASADGAGKFAMPDAAFVAEGHAALLSAAAGVQPFAEGREAEEAERDIGCGG